ncbi:MAG: efflux RND transporter periplasmic adaptor subunit [Hyphomicrobiales bacterium]|nr:efflux RND transporter periplasmic adaptor subunit [Hyphomicrobiales bacterium]MDE2113327.1 efflux RND transporter periplasmic adaptor subunit [Hyphomicrobiales bacterium]
MRLASAIKYVLVLAAGGAAVAIALPSVVQPFSASLASRAQAVHANIASRFSSSPPAKNKSAMANKMPPVNVLVAQAIKGPLPLIVDTVGTVQTIANVALRSHIDAQIASVMVKDGAKVDKGQVLVKLDDRQVQAQIEQANANLSKDNVQESQASRDLQRAVDLLARGAGTKLAVDTARTNETALKASIAADQAALDNLKVQLSWYTITAPISGRIGVFSAKQGNIIRAADSNATGVLVSINQMTPIYVAFSLPQRQLASLREAMATTGATVIARPQGVKTDAIGKVSVIDNTIDPATGTIMVRATFDNEKETLWPGQLCDIKITLSVAPEAVTIPLEAVQDGQNGNYVFVIDKGVAKFQPVEVERTQDQLAVISKGLNGGETIVRDGAMRLVNGSKVIVRNSVSLNNAANVKAD